MAPVDDPKVTVIITVDEPSTGNYYAGQVAVPYAHSLFTDIFNYLNNKFSEEDMSKIAKEVVVPEVRGMKTEDAKKALKDINLECEVDGSGASIVSMDVYPGYTVKEGTVIKLNTSGSADDINKVAMPDICGYSKEAAYDMLTKLGISVSFEGEGTVNSQSISSGEVIVKGTAVKLILESDYKD